MSARRARSQRFRRLLLTSRLSAFSSHSLTEELEEARELIGEVWVLEPELIEVVTSDWLLEIVLEGKDVATEKYLATG